PASRQEGEVLALRQAFLLNVCGENFVETFKPNRTEGHDLCHSVRRLVNVGVAEDEQDPLRWTVDELYFGLQHGHAGALSPHQLTRDIKTAIFVGKKLVEVVARNSTWNIRITFLH